MRNHKTPYPPNSEIEVIILAACGIIILFGAVIAAFLFLGGYLR